MATTERSRIRKKTADFVVIFTPTNLMILKLIKFDTGQALKRVLIKLKPSIQTYRCYLIPQFRSAITEGLKKRNIKYLNL